MTKILKSFTELHDFDLGDECPVHGTKYRKIYTYGSTMTGETEVSTFIGCKCAVSVIHDPVGTCDSAARYHTTFGEASGRAVLHRELCRAKYGGM